MNRRTFISTTAAVSSLALSGCSMLDTGSTNDSPAVTDYSFEQVDSSDVPDDATVESVRDGAFTVVGTVTVGDGCTTIAVGSEPEFVENGELVKMMIGTRDSGEGACTQQLRYLGYRVAVEYDGESPQQVTVAQAGTDSETFTLDVKEAY